MRLLARGGVRIYPPRGEYQLVVETIEPVGKGALQQAFEDLKKRLDAEGLFAPERKRPLPLLPRRVGIVTSPTGAVIRDILRGLGEDLAGLELLLYPARVQGSESAGEIAQGVRALGKLPGLDVIILARGGGSLEDLWPFNDEAVARAISSSPVATISGRGARDRLHDQRLRGRPAVAHADGRRPAPASAEARRGATTRRLGGPDHHRHHAPARALSCPGRCRRVAPRLRGRARPGRPPPPADRRARTSCPLQPERLAPAEQRRVAQIGRRLEAFRWDRQLAARGERVERQLERLRSLGSAVVERGRAQLGQAAARLESLSPVAVLGRGYSLVWDHGERRLIRDAGDVEVGDGLKIRLHRGSLEATVTTKETP